MPEGVVWSDVTSYMMSKYNLEMAGGLGPTVGKARSRFFPYHPVPFRTVPYPDLLLTIGTDPMRSDQIQCDRIRSSAI